MREHPAVRFRVEPSPSGGYVVRLEGEDRPVSRFDTEEEADEWVARHAPAPASERPARPRSRRPHFAGLADGTQLIVRAPAAGDPPQARGAAIVAEHPATRRAVGAAGGVAEWTASDWAGRGVAELLRAEL